MPSDIVLISENRRSLRQETIAGIGWTAIAQIAKLTVQFAISIILARLLLPQDFGLVAMIAVFTGFAALFGELGFGAALIQRELVEERHFSSVFWLNLFAGLILTGLIMAVAPAVALFYGEPRLTPLTMLVALNFSIGPLNMVQSAILRRRMEFRSLALAEIAIAIVAGVVGILLATLGFGVWSLVWQMLTASSMTVVVLWWITGWRPLLLFDRQAVVDLLRFSANLVGFRTVNYWVRNGDDMLIGKFIGSGGLGIYARAYSIMVLPLNQITNILTRVMFPALSRVQNDKPLVKRTYLRALAMIALLSFPMMMGLLVVSEHFVLALYGPNWAEVIPILHIFSLLGMVQSIGTTVGWIYESQGRTDWMFRWGLGAGALLIASIVVGILIGNVRAVALSYALTSGVILLYPSFAIPGKLIGMTFGDLVQTVAGIFGCAAAMALLVWGIGYLLPADWTHIAYLAVQVPSGMAVYGALIHFFRLQAYREVREIIREQLHSRFRTGSLAVRL
jgi:PST family polysaccharide transporter